MRCKFKQKERVIRDEIVFTFSSKLQELLLGEASLDFKKAIEISRAYKITSSNKKERSINTETQKIDKVGVQSNLKQKHTVKRPRKPILHYLTT